MKNLLLKKCGIALLIFIFLILITMVLHPIGGKVAYLISKSDMIIFSHSAALLSLPFGWMGYWGLTKKLGTSNFLSVLALVTVSFGMLAVLMAGTADGLVLPFFLERLESMDADAIDKIRPSLQLNFSINRAFDYIYTISFCIALISWSVAILQTRLIPRWLGWFGLMIGLFVIAMVLSGLAVNKLTGLRISMIGIVIWTFCAAIVLIRDAGTTE